MSTARSPRAITPAQTGTRIAAYQLDRLPRAARRRGGVRSVRPHRHRDARCARQEPHPVRLDATRADRRACRRRLRARDRQARRRAVASRARPDQRRDRRRQRRARFDSDGRDRRRRAVVLLRPSSASGSESPPRRRASSRSTGRSASACIASIAPRICRGSWSARSTCAQTGRPGPVLVDVPMDIFSADLPVDAFSKTPARSRRPTLDPATAARIVDALADGRAAGAVRRRRRAVGARDGRAGGARRGARGARRAHADGEGLPARRSSAAARPDRLLGHCRSPTRRAARADLIVAIGTRLAEANSSSWDPRFTFAIPPTRLIHIDADPAEIGRNYPTELGVVADAKAALGVLVEAARGAKHTRRAARCATTSRAAAASSRRTTITSGSRTSSRCGRSGS